MPHDEPSPRRPVPGRRALVLVDPPTGALPRAVPPQPRRRDVPQPATWPAAGATGTSVAAVQTPGLPTQRSSPEPEFEGRGLAGDAPPPDRHPTPSVGQPAYGGRRAGRHALRRPESAG